MNRIREDTNRWKTVKKRRRRRTIICAVIAPVLLYSSIVFVDIPGISGIRDLYIETAMTTAAHQWLAEWIFPKFLIDRVMNRQVNNQDIISDPSLIHIATPDPEAPGDDHGGNDSPGGMPAAEVDTARRDANGNVILVDDRDQDLMIVEIKGTGFVGQIMLIPDPSRVVVRFTSKMEERGDFINTIIKDNGGIAGINANGFEDADGKGKGGAIIGYSIADGIEWGNNSDKYASAAFTRENVLIVGTNIDPVKHDIRDLVQWGPVLIANGKKLLSGSAGWGLQPRSAIGQKADGTVVLVTVDGRQPDRSLGITVGELADILFDYGVVNASLCDGGSSSIMGYNGTLVGIPSTPMKTTGRYLPNAIIVLKK